MSNSPVPQEYRRDVEVELFSFGDEEASLRFVVSGLADRGTPDMARVDDLRGRYEGGWIGGDILIEDVWLMPYDLKNLDEAVRNLLAGVHPLGEGRTQREWTWMDREEQH